MIHRRDAQDAEQNETRRVTEDHGERGLSAFIHQQAPGGWG